MGRRRNWLDRFRPAGAPGSPALPGVPADERPAENELRPVFALLEPTIAECTRLRGEAERRGSERRETAARDAARIVDDARRQAPAVRAEAQSRAMANADLDAARVRPAQAAEELRERIECRMPQVLESVLHELRRQLAELSGVELGQCAGERPRVPS